MVTELAHRGRWCALDSLKAARNSTLGARMAAQIGRYVTCRVSLRRVLAGRCGLDHLASQRDISLISGSDA